ncbi:MAG: hypothetical protein Q9M32_06155 [Sulfurimonas sp.]|nr:hypothetical protein [Sulfurimonas sp.]MDQ7060596.1 hypothetical protein [Sulfurimonas sp.]
MYKIILALLTPLFFLGCANFQVTGVMCDQVRSDPTATVPSECRRYVDEDAQKAFDKETEILSTEDAIKFTK